MYSRGDRALFMPPRQFLLSWEILTHLQFSFITALGTFVPITWYAIHTFHVLFIAGGIFPYAGITAGGTSAHGHLRERQISF